MASNAAPPANAIHRDKGISARPVICSIAAHSHWAAIEAYNPTRMMLTHYSMGAGWTWGVVR